MTDDSPSRDTFDYPSFLTISDYDALEQNTNGNNTLEANLKCITFIISLTRWSIYYTSKSSKKTDLLTWRNLIELRQIRRPAFFLTGFKFKIAAESKSWIQAVENNRRIFDDLELQLIVRVKGKMLCENLKTPLCHFDDGWRHDIIYQICFCCYEFEILQHITSTS